MHLTLDVIGQSAFGYNFNTVLGGKSKVSEAVMQYCHWRNEFQICSSKIPDSFFRVAASWRDKKNQRS